MGINQLYTNEDFYNLKLKPVLSKPGYRSMRVVYNLCGVNNVVLGDEYLITRGLRIKPSFPIGLEPYALRRADQDDPARIVEFLYQISTGRLQPAVFRYMLSSSTQIEILTGQRPPILPLAGTQKTPKKQDANLKFAKDFAENVAIDDDVKRVAAKRDFDQKFVEKVLGERPHLLDDKGN